MSTTVRRRVSAAMVAMLAVAGAYFAFASSHSTIANGAGLKPAFNGSGENLTNGKRGGTLTVYSASDFEHLDPGSAYYVLDYTVMYATQMPLYEYPPNSSKTLAPMLATAMPAVTNHGLTVTVHIKPNVRFSAPVNRPVTSADVAYAIERGANPNVGNAYFQPYFGFIKGAAHATGGPISGIVTPNATTIVFHLTKPYSQLLIGALSLPITMPVPKSFAAPLDAKKPTQYGVSAEVFTGPYMIKSTPTGNLSPGFQPGKSLTLVRNPNWSSKDGPQPAYLDQININIGGSAQVIGQQVLTGSDSVQNDPPYNTNVQLAYQKHYNQLVAVPGAGDNYVSLNNSHGLFTNVNIRRAAYAVLDRAAMVKVAGGTIVGAPATGFITPGTSGYPGAAGPNYPWNKNVNGSLAVAERYMKKAGYPSGRYTGNTTLKVVSANIGNSPQQAAILKQDWTSIGLKVKLSLVDQATLYAKYCGVPKAEIDACPSVGWVRDFDNAETLFLVPFYGPEIVPTNNSNWGQVNEPALNRAFLKAAAVQGTAASAKAWSNYNDLLVNNAVAIPWIFNNQPWLRSANVRGINDLWNTGTWDYAYTSLTTP